MNSDVVAPQSAGHARRSAQGSARPPDRAVDDSGADHSSGGSRGLVNDKASSCYSRSMARRARVGSALLIGLVLMAPYVRAAEARGSILARYSFDDDVPTGPDTFRIFQYSKGTVRLTSAYHVSGYRAIELRDVAGDKSMPEIQGYFPVQSQGRLLPHRHAPGGAEHRPRGPALVPGGEGRHRVLAQVGAGDARSPHERCVEEAVRSRGLRLVLRGRRLRRGSGRVRSDHPPGRTRRSARVPGSAEECSGPAGLGGRQVLLRGIALGGYVERRLLRRLGAGSTPRGDGARDARPWIAAMPRRPWRSSSRRRARPPRDASTACRLRSRSSPSGAPPKPTSSWPSGARPGAATRATP